ncbi:class I SAM-dependent methyltransferase [Paenibacillus sp. KQZ6P-2]|uniref:Class I SAM-dependent methyltransferase n=1 Tax=Paenibacillus mangrovi TaxID=2931978 RepID=A0A9X1WKW3_9BACL|nr:class I SAM-dependent methyltransferase [Paenibacillus mangrovi]MCJ8010764.1 class I SAM-dependent methyltransferase [Paenibacillus mangrovi]
MNISLNEGLTINKDSWDAAAERFFGRTALPVYGPHSPSEEELNLFGDITGKRALEIGCGSGHSIMYMLEQGVEEIWGLDLSTVQIQTAQKVCGYNEKVKLLESSMEQDPGIPHCYFDYVYSIYALGWTLDLKKTLHNIHSYLRPGGTFIFSWEHPIHSRVILDNEIIRFNASYNEEKPALHEAWKPRPAVFFHRKISTYINELIEVGFIIEKVLEEVKIDRETKNENSWYSSIKAELYPATFIIKCKKI